MSAASPAQIIQQALVDLDESVFTDPDLDDVWPLHISNMPDGPGVPAEVGVVYDTTGEPKGRLLTSGKEIERYGVQIRIRSRNYDVGLLMREANLLSTLSRHEVTVDGDTYRIDTFSRTGPVLALPLDQSMRWHFTVNGLVFLMNY